MAIVNKDLSQFLNKRQIKKIFFYRICGTGMGNAALLLREKGYEISGGDLFFYPPMGDFLKKANIELLTMPFTDHSFLNDFDLVVVGNVVAKNSSEAKELEKLSVPCVSFPDALGELLLKEKEVCGVAGTHGKTTTTFFLAQMGEALGLKAGHLIGGVLEGAMTSAKLGEGERFFIESDEYDSCYFQKQSKFHSYAIHHLILTSLEFDHGDIFPNLEAIEKEFSRLFAATEGVIIYDSFYPSIDKLLKEHRPQMNKVYAYGLKSDIGPFDIIKGQTSTSFSLCLNGQKREQFETSIEGEHNILNLTACILYFYHTGLSVESIQEATKKLALVKRRQEEKGSRNNKIFVDDFAHHPTALRMTLKSIQEKYKNKKVSVIFYPMSATSRSDYFRDEFAEGLSLANRVFLLTPKRDSGVKGIENLNCHVMKKEIEKRSKAIVNVFADESSFLNFFLKILKDEEKNAEEVVVVFNNTDMSWLWESLF